MNTEEILDMEIELTDEELSTIYGGCVEASLVACPAKLLD